MQVFSNNRNVSHFPKAPPPSAHAKLRARLANHLLQKPRLPPPRQTRISAPKTASLVPAPSRAAIPNSPPQETAAHFGKILSGRRAKIRMPPPKEKFAPPEPSTNFKPRAKTAANGLRGSLPAILPTAPEYAFGLFPKRRRLSWRTGGWRNILRRARRAPRKRGRPFAG